MARLEATDATAQLPALGQGDKAGSLRAQSRSGLIDEERLTKRTCNRRAGERKKHGAATFIHGGGVSHRFPGIQ